MDARQTFKFGFLQKCAQLGLHPSEIETALDQLLTKEAFGDTLGKLIDTAAGVGGIGLAAGGILGAGTGYLLGNATEQPLDTDEVKKRELITVLQQYAAQAKRNAARTQYRQPAPIKPPSLF